MLLNYLEPSFNLGPLTVHLYGLSLAIALVAGLSLALRRAKEKKVPADTIWELSVYAVIGALAGARLLSVALHYQRFLADPLYLLRIHEGGLAFYGGLAGGALAGYLYLRRKRVSFWTAADVFAPSLALGEAITRLGCDVYGLTSVSAPWPRVVGGVPHHNIPLYMAVFSLLLFVFLWVLRDRVGQGQLFLIYLGGYFAGRVIIDFFRSEPLIGFLNGAQLAALALLAGTLLLIFRRRKRPLAG